LKLAMGLVAVPGTAAVLALVISALAVAGAVSLPRELDQPFPGLNQVSREPILKALSQLGK